MGIISSDSESARTYYHYVSDNQGSVRLILTDTINDRRIRNYYCYDAFGESIISHEDVHNRFRFNGEQYDTVTSQYYLRARFYNPVIGRFTQEDTYYGDGLNLYEYCRNNPVFYRDPSGNDAVNQESLYGNGGSYVTYRRVQGGMGNQSSQLRVIIDSEGNVYINKKDRNLNLSIDNGEHSQYYVQNKRPGADIYEFDVPKWFDDMVKEYTIPQAGYKNNPFNQGGSAPKLTDPTTPGKSVEFPVPWIEWIEEYATNGRIISGGQ